MTSRSEPQIGTVKSAAFRVLALLLPIVFLVVLELILRLFGVEDQRRLPFYRVEGKSEYVAFNPDFAKRYFRRFAPGAAFNPILPEKPDSVFRVFALGGSSAAGYPYGFMYGFPARLESRLEAYLPELRVEVVNLAMTAVNSYTLWHLTDYLLDYEPDAVVIYAGHNEYYGAFGAGSTLYSLGNQVWLKRLTLRLKGTVLFTLLERLVMSQPDARNADGLRNTTMMAQVVGDRSIEYGGGVFQKGIEQFELNLGDVLGKLQRAGVPTYVGTVASNLRDQPPLGTDSVAAATYRRGAELAALGDSVAARAAFLQAKELDDVRFRAPEAINEVIRELAPRSGATLVDIESRLREASRGGIEGEDLFVDHLHPTHRGYDLMAEAFEESLRDHPVLAGRPRLAGTSLEGTIDRLGQASAEIQILRLTAGYPFRRDVTPDQEARFYRRLLERYSSSGNYADSLAVQALERVKPVYELLYESARMARARSDTLNALRFYRALLYWQPFNEELARDAIGLAIGNPQYDAFGGALSRFAYNRTGALFPLDALAAVQLRRGDLDGAQRLLEASEARDPSGRTMLYNRARLLVLEGDTVRAREYYRRYVAGGSSPRGEPDSTRIRAVLSQALQSNRGGDYVQALAIVDSAAALAGGPDADVEFTRGLILMELGRLEGAGRAFREALTLSPEYRGAWHNLGNTAYQASQFREAVAAYGMATRQSAAARSYHALGAAYDKLGAADSALWAYQKAIDIDEDYAPAYMSLAEWHEDSGDFEQALGFASRAAELDPENLEFASKLGRMQYRAGRFEDSVRTLSSVSEARPWDYNALFNLGQSQARLGLSEQAAETLRRAEEARIREANLEQLESSVRQLPEDFGLRVAYADALRDGGRLRDAIRAYHVALALRPGNLSIRTNIATLLLRSGQSAEALRRYREIVSEDSTVVEVWANLALFYARQQQSEAAEAALDRLRRLEPQHPVVQRLDPDRSGAE
jgi:tetratricopeptide (TPR) repeat protein